MFSLWSNDWIDDEYGAKILYSNKENINEISIEEELETISPSGVGAAIDLDSNIQPAEC